MENTKILTIEQKLDLLTDENLQLINRQIEILLTSQSSGR